MKKSIVLLIALMLLLVACDGVYIEQDISKNYNQGRCEIDYTIETSVYVKNWYGITEDVSYWEYRRNIKKKDLDSLMVIEYNKANKIATQVRECFFK